MAHMEGGEPDKRLEVVMAEALRALSHQQALLDNVRSRATLLTTAATLVSSVLGAPAIAHGHLGWPAAVALIGLVGVVACTCVICAPGWQWRFRSSARVLLEAVDGGHDLDSMRRNLAINFEDWLDLNERKIHTMQWWFVAGLGLLTAELLGWAIQYRDAWG
jgi:hypothetical protein